MGESSVCRSKICPCPSFLVSHTLSLQSLLPVTSRFPSGDQSKHVRGTLLAMHVPSCWSRPSQIAALPSLLAVANLWSSTGLHLQPTTHDAWPSSVLRMVPSSTCQSLALPSAYPASRASPVLVNDVDQTILRTSGAYEWSSRPLPTSQSLAEQSVEAVETKFPSLLQSTLYMPLPWPSSTTRDSAVSAFHNIAVASREPVTTWWPCADQHNDVTESLWPRKTLSCCVVYEGNDTYIVRMGGESGGWGGCARESASAWEGGCWEGKKLKRPGLCGGKEREEREREREEKLTPSLIVSPNPTPTRPPEAAIRPLQALRAHT